MAAFTLFRKIRKIRQIRKYTKTKFLEFWTIKKSQNTSIWRPIRQIGNAVLDGSLNASSKGDFLSIYVDRLHS